MVARGCDWVAAGSLPIGPHSPPPGGMRRCRLGPAALLALLGGVLAGAGGGGRALPQLSDDIPFRVNWPGTDFSLVSAGAPGPAGGESSVGGEEPGGHSVGGSPGGAGESRRVVMVRRVTRQIF